MSASSPSTSAIHPTARRLGLLRAGLIIAAIFALLGVGPSLDLGFDDTVWDTVLIVFAILSGVAALGTIICLILGWNGRPGAAIAAIVLLVISLIPSIPAFFLPGHETTAEGPGPFLAVTGIVVGAGIIALILFGLRRARMGQAVSA